MRADLAVECSSPQHERAKRLAFVGIGSYPIGISLLYAVLMLRARRAILDDKPTVLSRALGFLVRDYEAECTRRASQPHAVRGAPRHA